MKKTVKQSDSVSNTRLLINNRISPALQLNRLKSFMSSPVLLKTKTKNRVLLIEPVPDSSKPRKISDKPLAEFSLFALPKMASLLDSLTTRGFFTIPSISRISSSLASSSSFASSSSSISSFLTPSVLSYSHQHSHSRFPFPVSATLDGSSAEEELDFEEFEEFAEDNYADDSDIEDDSIDISVLEKEARDIVRDYATTLSRELKLGNFGFFFLIVFLSYVWNPIVSVLNNGS